MNVFRQWYQQKLKALRPESLPIMAGAFACCFWFFDSAMDVYVFEKYRLYVESLLGPNSIDLWTRCQVVILLMSFSLVAMLLLRQQVHATRTLRTYKRQLEAIVQKRTDDLRTRNAQLENEIEERQKVESKLEHQASIDPLTSIFNRRKFNEVLSYELRRDERYHNGLSFVLCDLDNFKSINDDYGHSTGDEVLALFARLVKNCIRGTDTLARWGGEEFALLLPETGYETAIQIAEKIRLEAEGARFSTVNKITVSFGVTQYLEGDTAETLFKRADEALYKAKDNGRNRIEVNPPLHILLKALSGV